MLNKFTRKPPQLGSGFGIHSLRPTARSLPLPRGEGRRCWMRRDAIGYGTIRPLLCYYHITCDTIVIIIIIIIKSTIIIAKIKRGKAVYDNSRYYVLLSPIPFDLLKREGKEKERCQVRGGYFNILYFLLFPFIIFTEGRKYEWMNG
ncbi:hypothetical protein L873DRAFT_1213526 [Choiromyces venosus 120613-1]|uniref:Uncharacterized protein n=1 Tax=Choiromyces venosus 120613-1 TaxID=1336337 RepID=A0A3N4JJY9_9PEZI|nr:hypothetical protein L873DRAFT_1213526 [Choiromyces venosus 120613-1]